MNTLLILLAAIAVWAWTLRQKGVEDGGGWGDTIHWGSRDDCDSGGGDSGGGDSG